MVYEWGSSPRRRHQFILPQTPFSAKSHTILHLYTAQSSHLCADTAELAPWSESKINAPTCSPCAVIAHVHDDALGVLFVSIYTRTSLRMYSRVCRTTSVWACGPRKIHKKWLCNHGTHFVAERIRTPPCAPFISMLAKYLYKCALMRRQWQPMALRFRSYIRLERVLM